MNTSKSRFKYWLGTSEGISVKCKAYLSNRAISTEEKN